MSDHARSYSFYAKIRKENLALVQKRYLYPIIQFSFGNLIDSSRKADRRKIIFLCTRFLQFANLKAPFP
jgi:hypothetical protein